MRTRGWEPSPGDPVVDLKVSSGSWDRDRVGPMVTVKTVTTTLVITTDGEKYNRGGLFPIAEGRHSDRVLIPVWDDRAICVAGRLALANIAQLSQNLAALNRTDPADIVAAYNQIAAAATESRGALIDMMRNASRKGRA